MLHPPRNLHFEVTRLRSLAPVMKSRHWTTKARGFTCACHEIATHKPHTNARHLDYTPALNPYRKNPLCDHTVQGNKGLNGCVHNNKRYLISFCEEGRPTVSLSPANTDAEQTNRSWLGLAHLLLITLHLQTCSVLMQSLHLTLAPRAIWITVPQTLS